MPLGDVMAMTEHTSISTVMGYFQSGNMLNSAATTLLAGYDVPEVEVDDSSPVDWPLLNRTPIPR